MIANPTETAAGSLIVQPDGDDNEPEVFDVKANMTLSTALKLPMVKLTVSGKLRNSSVADGPEKAIQRAIVFVIDRSGSMVCFVQIIELIYSLLHRSHQNNIL